MKITFDTLNSIEVEEVIKLLSIKTETPVKVTESKVEEPKPKKTTPSIPKVEKEPDEPKKTPTKITLADLKELAKKKVVVSGREKVKEIIGEFAPKLSEVEESDYSSLASKLAI